MKWLEEHATIELVPEGSLNAAKVDTQEEDGVGVPLGIKASRTGERGETKPDTDQTLEADTQEVVVASTDAAEAADVVDTNQTPEADTQAEIVSASTEQGRN